MEKPGGRSAGRKKETEMKFYNVKKRKSVLVEDSRCVKTTFVKGDRVTYAVKCTDDDGTKCTLFVCKATWDSLACPEA